MTPPDSAGLGLRESSPQHSRRLWSLGHAEISCRVFRIVNGRASQLIPYEQIVQPEKFRAAIAVWRQQPRLWIDTEVADWSTPNPRLSLLQVRTAAGPNVVVDVLEGVMRQILHEEFIPQIMESDQVEKWAHYARYERRF